MKATYTIVRIGNQYIGVLLTHERSASTDAYYTPRDARRALVALARHRNVVLHYEEIATSVTWEEAAA